MSEDDLPIFFEHKRERILRDETVVKQTILLDESVAGGVVSFERDGKREVGYEELILKLG